MVEFGPGSILVPRRSLMPALQWRVRQPGQDQGLAQSPERSGRSAGLPFGQPALRASRTSVAVAEGSVGGGDVGATAQPDDGECGVSDGDQDLRFEVNRASASRWPRPHSLTASSRTDGEDELAGTGLSLALLAWFSTPITITVAVAPDWGASIVALGNDPRAFAVLAAVVVAWPRSPRWRPVTGGGAADEQRRPAVRRRRVVRV